MLVLTQLKFIDRPCVQSLLLILLLGMVTFLFFGGCLFRTNLIGGTIVVFVPSPFLFARVAMRGDAKYVFVPSTLP